MFIIAFVLLAGVYAGFAYRRRKQTEINNLLEEYDRTIQIIDALNSDKEEMLRNHQQELNSIMNSLQSKGIDCPESTDGPAIRDEVLSRFKDFVMQDQVNACLFLQKIGTDCHKTCRTAILNLCFF